MHLEHETTIIYMLGLPLHPGFSSPLLPEARTSREALSTKTFIEPAREIPYGGRLTSSW